MVFESTSPRRAEVYHFRLPALILVPLLALVLQTFLPLYFGFETWLDLPLLVVIYFALSSRSPVAGLLAGALMGVAQDSLSRDAVGLYGITDTVIGYVTPFVSGRVDTERTGVRLLTVFILYHLQFICLYLLRIILPGELVELPLVRTPLAALVNSLVGVVLFGLLDRFRRPA